MTFDATRYRETVYLKPTKKVFYPLRIPIKHHQLRHYINVAEDGTVYYLSENDVWALHTKTRRRERLATLAFAPQCLGGGFGWICVGSLSGKCAFIKIRDTTTQGSGSSTSTGDVDELLPLDLDPQPRDPSHPSESTHRRSTPSWSRAQVHTRIICSEIVNSITMFRMKSPLEGVSDEDFAVISSNDKSVQLFSLTELRAVHTVQFPVPMNHATMSPDGTMLVACGDDKAAFFVKRLDHLDEPIESKLYDKVSWTTPLRCQLPVDGRMDHCFSTAFSPSGHICTIASQYGQVTVFDMEKVKLDMDEREAILDTFTSSRPAQFHEESHFIEMPGAIRSTAFSPNPWDLFAWAEDQGRICITDLRDGFRSVQRIQLDLKSKDLEDVEIVELGEDLESEEVRALANEMAIFRRQRQAAAENDSGLAIQSVANNIEAAARRRRLHEAAGSNTTPHELTNTERQVLETLRLERLRDNVNSVSGNPSEVPFSINYTNQPSSRTPGNPHSTSIRQYTRERSQDQSSTSMPRPHNPRRQPSIVIANSNISPTSTTPHPSSLEPNIATGEIVPNIALSASPSRLSSTSNSHSPVPGTPLSRQTSSGVPSLIPAPTSADPWAATSTNLTNPGTTYSLPQYSLDRTGPSNTISNITSTIEHNHLMSHMDAESLAQQADARNDEERERNLNSIRDSNRPRERPRDTPRESNRQLSSQHADLEQARAQLVRLTAAVEADTEDVLRHLRVRVSSNRSAPGSTFRNRDEGITSPNPIITNPSSQQQFTTSTQQPPNDPTDTSSTPPSVSLTGIENMPGPAGEFLRQAAAVPPWSSDGDRRMYQLRPAQLRRLQERAANAVGTIGATGSGGVSREDARERSALSSLIGAERDHGMAVMGMGWSRGGGTLFVATEEGIFEFEVNLERRREFPGISLR